MVCPSSGKTSINQTINIEVNDIPRLEFTPIEFVATPYGKVTKPEAVNLIKSWLQNKKSVFASPYDIETLDKYTTGLYYQGRLDSLNWLKENNAYYSYGKPTVEASSRFKPQGVQVVIDVRVYQTTTLLVNGKIDQSKSSPDDGIYRYTLSYDNGSWKIADSQKLP